VSPRSNGYSIGSASGKAAALSDAAAIDALRANLPPELADFDMAGIHITRQHWSESDFISPFITALPARHERKRL